MADLIFFNKEGDYLNFNYNDTSKIYSGDMLFSQNGSDTFKTIGLYTFEKIPAFDFESNNMYLDKFQLFNEYGINFSGSSYLTQSILTIKAVNNDPTFYSKWIYGIDFEKKYPIGTNIIFTNNIFDFSASQSYSVVGSKKGAIMVLSPTNNRNFNASYSSVVGLTSSYTNKYLSGLNSIGIYNYIDSNSNQLLSSWSQPDFYDKYFSGRKLNIVGASANGNKVVTVCNSNFPDKTYYRYTLNKSDFPNGEDLIIEVILKTDLPVIYQGGVNASGNKLTFNSTVSPLILPGKQFSIVGSTLNSNFLTIANIPSFIGNNTLTYYATYSHVLWNNIVYESIKAYTQSATSSIDPDNPIYWTKNITYLNTNEALVSETLLNAEIYLSSNVFYFGYTGASNSDVTLSSAASKYSSDILSMNTSLYYKDHVLYADLMYPSKYNYVNFYHTAVGPTYSIGKTQSIFENIVQVEETLIDESNHNLSTRFKYNIVFTDIDTYGISLTINGLKYDQEILWEYSGLNVDMPRTIDRTLRSWLSKNVINLNFLGIICSLDYLANYPYIYFDSIVLQTEYPNVPIDFSVYVGNTANFYIQHSSITFYYINNVLSLTINGIRYDQPFNVDIRTTISDWINTHSSIISQYDVFISSVNNVMYFNIKNISQNLNYVINVGKSSLPGEYFYSIDEKISGNIGCLISSNGSFLSEDVSNSFLTPNISGSADDQDGFATGMVVSLNNTIYPIQNQQYNILEVDDYKMIFSYQGPFWSNPTQSSGETSSILLGAYSPLSFDFSFDTIRTSNNYYSVNKFQSIPGLVDSIYINISESTYVLGDYIRVYDGISSAFIEDIQLPNSSNTVKFVYNPFSEFLFTISQNMVYKIDPSLNQIVATYSTSYIAYDSVVNTYNGDIYISYSNRSRVDIIDVNGMIYNLTASYIGSATGSYHMVYNQLENDVYLTMRDGTSVWRINGKTRSERTYYIIPSLKPEIIYEPIDSSIYIMGSVLSKINRGSLYTISSINSSSFNDIFYDNIRQSMVISQDTLYTKLNLDNTLNYSLIPSSYGNLIINQYDGEIYMASPYDYKINIINPSNGNIVYMVTGMTSSTTKMMYNPRRRSIWGLIPGLDQIIEINVTIQTTVDVGTSSYNGIYNSQYGTLDPYYIPKENIWIKSRDYIRRPRENHIGDSQVQYVWTWQTDDVSDIFMYDFSGTQLETDGPYGYIGEIPLQTIHLNKNSNKDIGKTASSEYQQTIFSQIVHNIDYINSSVNLTYMPEPMELFLGFRSINEGPQNSTLLLLKRESINFTITTSSTNMDIFSFEYVNVNDDVTQSYGIISIYNNSNSNFLFDSLGKSRGLKVGQNIKVLISDVTNTNNKYLSFNNGGVFRISQIYVRSIIVHFMSDIIVNESSVIEDYPKTGLVTYLSLNVQVVDKTLGIFNVYGQTEIEDIRYEIELTNSGKNITADQAFIFKSYDIEEQGVDWIFLNSKRKEMLMVKDQIFPYIGSYKAIINSINYFGYNDLNLYEYYRNVNILSPNYNKLSKVEISNIFDNSVKGWSDNDVLKLTMPNPNYEDTNLLNLTFNITDRLGNNTLLYSLQEVLIKLQGLKSWLQNNVIPISHKILDITGRTDFLATNSIVHRNYDTSIFNVNQSMSPIYFSVNEAYLMPINSGSTVYNVVIDFYCENIDYIPDYFDVRVRTYKIYPEWYPFSTYGVGDIVSYYNIIYKSEVDNNRINDPRFLQSSPKWNINFDYQPGQIVEYNRYFYEFIGTQSIVLNGTSSVVSPYLDNLYSFNNWIDVTKWRILDYQPVQTLREYRTGTQSFNFTVDSNIDPYITIEVTSDNGYGQTYTSKKNYQIQGVSSDNILVQNLDPIGPIIIYPMLTSTTTSTTSLTTTIIVTWQAIDPYCLQGPSTTTSTTTTTTTVPTTTSTTTTTTTVPTTTTSTTTTTTTMGLTAVCIGLTYEFKGGDLWFYGSASPAVDTNEVVSFIYSIDGGVTASTSVNFTSGSTFSSDKINFVTGTTVVITQVTYTPPSSSGQIYMSCS